MLGPGWSPLSWPFLLAALRRRATSKKRSLAGPKYQVEEIRPPSTKRKKRRPSTYPLKRPGLIIASKMAVNFMVPRTAILVPGPETERLGRAARHANLFLTAG